MKVAIIDDNLVFRTLTKIAFENVASKNIEVLLFENGQEAIDFIKSYEHNIEQLPKIILLDLNMPVMDGWDFLEAMLPIKHTKNLNLVIYIVSSSEDEEDISRAKAISDIKGYIIKPIGLDRITELIAEVN